MSEGYFCFSGVCGEPAGHAGGGIQCVAHCSWTEQGSSDRVTHANTLIALETWYRAEPRQTESAGSDNVQYAWASDSCGPDVYIGNKSAGRSILSLALV